MTEPLPSLEELGRKIEGARKDEVAPSPSTSARGTSLAWRIGIELVSGTGVGTAVGYALDRWLGTMPLFLIICLLLGTAGGVLTMMRSVQSLQKAEEAGTTKGDEEIG